MPFGQIVRWFSSLMIVASTVLNRMPINRAPRTFRATSVAVTTRPSTNTRIGRCRRFGVRVTIGWPDFGWTTRPAFTRPMKAMNRPIPMPMARLRSIGMAFSTASRNPVSTSPVMTRPSTTMTPMACGQVRPSAPTRVKATNAFRPSPAASANGYLP